MKRTSFTVAHLAAMAFSTLVTASALAQGVATVPGAVDPLGSMPFGEAASSSVSAEAQMAGAGITAGASVTEDAVFAGTAAGMGVYGVGADGISLGSPGAYAFGYPTNELFYNYYVPPVNGGIGAEMYVAPLPVPPHVGHTYFTYQPFYPHEMLYRHHRTYYRPHPGFEGYPTGAAPYTRVDVRWTNGRQPFQFAPSILRSRPPVTGFAN